MNTAPTDPSPTGLVFDGPTRVAVVGAGYIADFHLKALAETDQAQVIAVCDTDRAKAERAAKEFGIPNAVTDLAELPGLGVQVVHLTVPPPLHVPLATECLDLGMGVFVEKPLALTSAEARVLEDRSRARDLPLAVNHNMVWTPAMADLLKRVEAGEIGRVEHVRATLSVPLRQLDAHDYTHWMFQAPRNIVFEQATHPVSQLERLIGGVKSCETTLLGSRELNPGQVFHDRWLIAAHGERGTAEIHLAFGQDFTRHTLEVLGTDGSLEADIHHDHLSGEQKTLYLDFFNSFLAGVRRARMLRVSAWRVLFGWMGFTLGITRRKDAFYVGMRDSIVGFHHALRLGTELPGNVRSAVRVADWCEAIAQGIPGETPEAAAIPEPGPARPGEVVVTGATGFIGRRVVEQLLEKKVPVTAVSRRDHSLPPEILKPALDGRLRFVQTSLEDEEGLARALEGAATCIHLAKGAGDDWETVERYMVRGSERVGLACLEAGVKRLVYVSSIAALYGGPDAGHEEISDDVGLDPRVAERPVYARGKAEAEKVLLALHASKGLPVTIARPGVVVGRGFPMQHSGIGLWVRDNHCVGWGRGDHPLPLVWVDDTADALVRAAMHTGSELDGRCWNVCARPPLTAQDVVEEMAKHTGRKLAFHPRSMVLSQAMEIGKWIVKKVGRRPNAEYPSWRSLKSRSLAIPYRCETAREVLGWQPTEDRQGFLDAAIRVHT